MFTAEVSVELKQDLKNKLEKDSRPTWKFTGGFRQVVLRSAGLRYAFNVKHVKSDLQAQKCGFGRPRFGPKGPRGVGFCNFPVFISLVNEKYNERALRLWFDWLGSHGRELGTQRRKPWV